MLNRNFAGVSANIGAQMPKVQALEQPDWGKVLSGAIKDWSEGKKIQQSEEDKKALIAALQGGDSDAINAAWAQYDPNGYNANRVALDNFNAQQEARRQEIANNQAFQREMLNTNNKNAMALELLKQQNKAAADGNLGILDKKRLENIGKNMDNTINESQSRINDYNRLEQLLQDKDVSTGGFWGAVQENIHPALLNSKTQELQSIINKIVPQMRPAGSGTTSDRDMAIFEKATVGLEKNKDANLNIVKGRRAVDENTIAREELRADWVNNGGSLNDFDRQWKIYVEANPIFRNENGTLNEARINAYDWFGGRRQTQDNQQNSDPLGLR